MALERVHKKKIKEMSEVVHEAFNKSFSVRESGLLLSGQQRQRKYTYINSPAFFGESQLFTEKGIPEPALYSARCLTRAEFTTLGKDDIEMVLHELPYLRHAEGPVTIGHGRRMLLRTYHRHISQTRSLTI